MRLLLTHHSYLLREKWLNERASFPPFRITKFSIKIHEKNLIIGECELSSDSELLVAALDENLYAINYKYVYMAISATFFVNTYLYNENR